LAVPGEAGGLCRAGPVSPPGTDRKPVLSLGEEFLPDDLPAVRARAGILIDRSTGAVLWQKASDRRLHPASLTKMMTLLLAAELGRPDELVRVSRAAAYTHGSDMGLRPGELWRLHDLMLGMALASGNDAAVAVAEHLGGSVSGFARLMNRRAEELGMRDSRFYNPHGLTRPGHHTTAADLGRLALAVLNRPELAQMVAASRATVFSVDGNRQVDLYSTNHLLPGDEQFRGIKTGTTSAAGRCLAACAIRDGHTLVSVVLNSSDRYGATRRLLDWGFDRFEWEWLPPRGEELAALFVSGGLRREVKVGLPYSRALPLPRTGEGESTERPRWVLTLPPRLAAPVVEGQRVGQLVVTCGGHQLARLSLVALSAVPRAGAWGRFLHRLRGALLGPAG